MVNNMADEEKGTPSAPVIESLSDPLSPKQASNAFDRFNARLATLHLFESRGIERVPEEQRQAMRMSDYLQMGLLWFSTNLTANNMAIGILGPTSYSLGFVDAALCATFGAVLGAAGVAYMATFGPASGNRTLVCGFCHGKPLKMSLIIDRSLLGTLWVTTLARLHVS